MFRPCVCLQLHLPRWMYECVVFAEKMRTWCLALGTCLAQGTTVHCVCFRVKGSRCFLARRRNYFLCYCQRTTVSGPRGSLGAITATEPRLTSLHTYIMNRLDTHSQEKCFGKVITAVWVSAHSQRQVIWAKLLTKRKSVISLST